MNTDIEIQTVRDDSNLSFKSSSPQQKKLNNKRLGKYLPTSVFYSKKSSTVIMDKEIDYNAINKSIQSMSITSIPLEKEKSLTYVAYIPTTHNSVVLIASLPRDKIFMDAEYENLSMRDVKYAIAQELLDIPDTFVALEQQARKGVRVYNFRSPSQPNSIQQPIQQPIEDTIPPTNIDLKVWDNSIIYVKKYFSNLSANISDLTHKCGGAMCIESNVSLLSKHEIYELRKNNDMKEILETKSGNKKYTFNICVNSVITNLAESVYLNFFNIPEEDLKYILKNPNVGSLGVTRCNANQDFS